MGWLRRQGLGDSDAEDLVQEILVVVLRELACFQHNTRPGAFRAWLRTITVHRLQDFIRARQYRPIAGGDSALLDQVNQLEDPASAPSRQWDQEHDAHVVRRLLALIEPDFEESSWQAFRAVMFEGQTPSAAAARLGMSVNAVLLSKSRILSRLRQEARGFVDF